MNCVRRTSSTLECRAALFAGHTYSNQNQPIGHRTLMFIYSKKIISFVNEIKSVIKEILSKEVKVKVSGNRFFNPQQTFSYPIVVAIYNNKNMLGYFDSNFFELGFHECLMHANRAQLHNIIRHELAHYMTFIKYGPYVDSHGVHFRDFCKSLGWGEDVYQATILLEGAMKSSEIEENSILRKIQKLMALSTSSNQNEAEQAMIKSQQLLLKHNIDEASIAHPEDEKIFLKRIMQQKKENAKMRSIARILETFFVSAVYRRANEFICLEILGNATNLEIAEYVAEFLQQEFEKLWEQASRLTHLKGMTAKNSFFQGIATGYCNKINALKRGYNTEVSNALMVIEKKLIDAQEMVYNRLSAKSSKGNYCEASSKLGEMMGRQLNINPAINKSPKYSDALLPFK